jgi:hypothetical protein
VYWRRFWKFAFCAAGLALLPAPAGSLITIGSLELGTGAGEIVVANDIAYLAGYWSGLRVIDVSDPEAPVELGTLDTPGNAFGIAVADALVYLADRGSVSDNESIPSSLRIIDVSDPTAPFMVGAVEVSSLATDVAVVDDIAYLTVQGFEHYPGVGPSGLHVFDVSEPSAPVEIGAIDTAGFPSRIEVVEDLAYIADWRGLQVIDVSDPTAPAVIGSVPVSGLTADVAVENGLAYVANEPPCAICAQPTVAEYGLAVIDVSDPTAPIEIGYAPVHNGGSDVSVVDGLAYLASYRYGLQVVDVSNPEAPAPLGTLGTASFASSVDVADGLAYIVDGWVYEDSYGGLRVIDISNPETPVELGAIDEIRETYGIAVAEEIAYLADGDAGLRVIDASNPAEPVEIGAADTPDLARGVAVADGLAYVADSDSGLRVIDVGNPATPIEIGAIDTPGTACDVAVTDNLALVADGASGMRVIDVSDPALPVEIGALENSRYASTLAVKGELAFLIANRALHIVDISDPTAPVVAGVFLGGPVQSVAVGGEIVYVADAWYPGGLRAIDVSNPAAPTEIGRFEASRNDHSVSWGDYSVSVMGDFAYFAGSRMHVIDISDPTNLVEAAVFHLADIVYALDVEAAGGRVYVSLQWNDWQSNDHPSQNTGLRIIDFGPEYAPTIEVAIDVKSGFNPARRGVIPVAILGSDAFDVADVDVTTLTCGPDSATPAHRRGGHPEDVNGDGVMDLVSHFWIQDPGITSEEKRVCVSGQLLDGAAFEGCGAI